jgi:hypothetical protein
MGGDFSTLTGSGRNFGSDSTNEQEKRLNELNELVGISAQNVLRSKQNVNVARQNYNRALPLKDKQEAFLKTNRILFSDIKLSLDYFTFTINLAENQLKEDTQLNSEYISLRDQQDKNVRWANHQNVDYDNTKRSYRDLIPKLSDEDIIIKLSLPPTPTFPSSFFLSGFSGFSEGFTNIESNRINKYNNDSNIILYILLILIILFFYLKFKI